MLLYHTKSTDGAMSSKQFIPTLFSAAPWLYWRLNGIDLSPRICRQSAPSCTIPVPEVIPIYSAVHCPGCSASVYIMTIVWSLFCFSTNGVSQSVRHTARCGRRKFFFRIACLLASALHFTRSLAMASVFVGSYSQVLLFCCLSVLIFLS